MTSKNIRWTGELLPRLRNILWTRNIPFRQVHIEQVHTGFITNGAVFVAKSKIWKDQVSTQKHLVRKCIERNVWLVFWIPGVGMLRFDPLVLYENSWHNMRGTESMLNIHTKFGKWIGADDLNMLPPQKSQSPEQLQLA